MPQPHILVVDDNGSVRFTLSRVLESHGFRVTEAADVNNALRCITQQKFDVLLSDLHMPGPGDGLTVVSAMRHANPEAVTLILSAFPEMSAATNDILLQADEILVKPMKIPDLIQAIQDRLLKGPLRERKVESLDVILERTLQSTIDDWYVAVENDEALSTIILDRGARCQHLPQLLLDLIRRLQALKPLGSRELFSESARHHGLLRRSQGYSAQMLVEESRLFQVTIFHTLEKNLHTIDYSVLLLGIMTIADEVDSQLSTAMKSYMETPIAEPCPVA